MILPKDPLDNLAYTARRSGLWVPMPLRFARRCCCVVTCEDCTYCENKWPAEIEAVITGVTGTNCIRDFGVFNACALFNDTFILSCFQVPAPCVVPTCYSWVELDTADGWECMDFINVWLEYDDPDFWLYGLFYSGGCEVYNAGNAFFSDWFRKNLGPTSPVDCNFSNEQLAWYQHIGGAHSCDLTSATMALSAV